MDSNEAKLRSIIKTLREQLNERINTHDELITVVGKQAWEIKRLQGELDKRADRLPAEEGKPLQWSIGVDVEGLRSESNEKDVIISELMRELAIHQREMAALRSKREVIDMNEIVSDYLKASESNC